MDYNQLRWSDAFENVAAIHQPLAKSGTMTRQDLQYDLGVAPLFKLGELHRRVWMSLQIQAEDLTGDEAKVVADLSDIARHASCIESKLREPLQDLVRIGLLTRGSNVSRTFTMYLHSRVPQVAQKAREAEAVAKTLAAEKKAAAGPVHGDPWAGHFTAQEIRVFEGNEAERLMVEMIRSLFPWHKCFRFHTTVNRLLKDLRECEAMAGHRLRVAYAIKLGSEDEYIQTRVLQVEQLGSFLKGCFLREWYSRFESQLPDISECEEKERGALEHFRATA